MATVVNFATYKSKREEEVMALFEPKDVLGKIRRAFRKKYSFSVMIEKIIADVARKRYDHGHGNRGRNKDEVEVTRIEVFPDVNYMITVGDIDSILRDNSTRPKRRKITEVRCWEGTMSDTLKEYCREHGLFVVMLEKN